MTKDHKSDESASNSSGIRKKNNLHVFPQIIATIVYR